MSVANCSLPPVPVLPLSELGSAKITLWSSQRTFHVMAPCASVEGVPDISELFKLAKFFVLIAFAVFSTLAGLVIAEVILRAFRYQPTPIPVRGAEDSYIEPDPVLGWVTKKLVHSVRTNAAGSQVQFSTTSDAARECPLEIAGEHRPQILVVGCSFTAGGAFLDNLDTYPCQLQKVLPQFEVKNFGVDAYGTYQSLLRMREVIEKSSQKLTIVYGFVDFHEPRNVAAWWWLEGISRLASQEIRLPYAGIGPDGELVEYPPIALPRVPFSRHSAFLAEVERQWIRISGMPREAQSERVTTALVKAMQDYAQSKGHDFLVVSLAAQNNPKEFYLEKFRSAGISTLDCTFPKERYRAHEITNPEDKHPNAFTNSHWSTCIGEGLRARRLGTAAQR
jgi:hypothetical protein